MGTVLVIGGYGNAGAVIARLLLEHSGHTVRVGGRQLHRARRLRHELCASDPGREARLEAIVVDAADPGSLRSALADVELCINAAGVAGNASALVETVLGAGTDYLDIQVGHVKARALLRMDERARAAGVTVVTDGGFHPGVPAAMARYAQQRLGSLERALVASVIAVDWRALRPLAESTVTEMMEEFRDFPYEEYRSGRWRPAGRQPRFVFPEPFGTRKASAMGLAEMHQLTQSLPELHDAGFYVGGFNPVVDYALVPLAIAGMRVAPERLGPPLGRLLHWGLLRFSRPPYGTVLQLEGAAAGEPSRTLMRVSHPDAYVVTAAATVAAALQMLDGTARRPGVHTQAMLVAPQRFFTDVAEMGLAVEWLPAATGSRSIPTGAPVASVRQSR